MISEIILRAISLYSTYKAMGIPVERITAEVEAELHHGEETHLGDKSIKCNQCEYSCHQSGDLKKHLKTHSGEKTNKCNQ